MERVIKELGSTTNLTKSKSPIKPVTSSIKGIQVILMAALDMDMEPSIWIRILKRNMKNWIIVYLLVMIVKTLIITLCCPKKFIMIIKKCLIININWPNREHLWFQAGINHGQGKQLKLTCHFNFILDHHRWVFMTNNWWIDDRRINKNLTVTQQMLHLRPLLN